MVLRAHVRAVFGGLTIPSSAGEAEGAQRLRPSPLQRVVRRHAAVEPPQVEMSLTRRDRMEESGRK